MSSKDSIKASHLKNTKDWLKKIKNAVDTFCDQAAKTKILSQITIVEQNLSEYKNVRQVCSNYFSTKIQENALKSSISELSNLMEIIKKG